MNSKAQIRAATKNFYTWEKRCRGYALWDRTVEIEPPFEPFYLYIPSNYQKDPIYYPSLLESIGSSISKIFKSKDSLHDNIEFKQNGEDFYEIAPIYSNEEHPDLETFRINLPFGSSVTTIVNTHLLIMLSDTKRQISFEIIGNANKILIQLVCRNLDAEFLHSQLIAYLPQNTKIDHIKNDDQVFFADDSYWQVTELGLKNEVMLPIQKSLKSPIDPLVSFYTLLNQLKGSDSVVLQILFKGTKKAWVPEIIEAVTCSDGSPFFIDAPEILPAAKEKVSSILFSAVCRVITSSNTNDSAISIMRQTLSIVRAISRSNVNEFKDLSNAGYNIKCHISDCLKRQSRRSGMLLNIEELVTFVHFPTSPLVSPKYIETHKKSKEVPYTAVGHKYILGNNIHNGNIEIASLSISQRLRHIHIIGATGTGKSTLLTNLIIQDMNNGLGFSLIDPHGDLVESVISYIPENRVNDVVIIDPSDFEFPIGFNILSAKTEVEKIVLSSDLISIFRRQSTSWGDQMTTILTNAINAFLESEQGGTLFDLRRFLIDDKFRNQFLKTVHDPTVINFWQQEYTMLRKNAIGPILTRMDTFIRPKIIRNMMAQKNGLDFADLMASNKIILIKLPQGLIGEENSNLLGSLIVSKIQQAAQSRQAIAFNYRNPHFLYIDEFQNFITPSMSAILSGSRKYSLGLVLAHQDMEQVGKYDNELANSILSNPGTRICFRVGDNDARKLERGFSFFENSDLQDLSIGEAIARIDISSGDFNLSTFVTPEYDNEGKDIIKDQCIELSRLIYSKPRKEIEELIFAMYNLEPIIEGQPTAEIQVKEPPLPKEEINEENTISDFQEKSIEFIKKVEEREKITEHRQLQTLIKKMAELRGFKAIIENPTPNGGRIDVALIKDDLQIAIEVSVTNTDSNEVSNIIKCIDSGYNPVIMCSNSVQHLSAIEIQAKAQSINLKNVMFYNPSELFTFLDTNSFSKSTEEKRIKGYRVKVKYNTEI